MKNDDIIRYYQNSQWLYRLFIYSPSTLGMHYGFWDSNTKNRQQAILNENEEIVRIGHITKNMRVLDAGCGVGGTAIYVAEQTGAQVWGITIDQKQILLASSYAKKRGVSPLTRFSTQDYTHANFPDNFFDVVYGIESICHANPKSSFLREAHRILKPGGKLIILDGYLGRKPKTESERTITDQFCVSFAVPLLITGPAMQRTMLSTGFMQCVMEDKTDAVLPTAREFARLANMTRVVCLLAGYIPHPFFQTINKNYRALLASDKAVQIGLMRYYVHVAKKHK